MTLTWRFVVFAAVLTVPVSWLGQWWAVLGGIAVLALTAAGDVLFSPSPRLLAAQRTPGARVRLGMDTSATLTLVNTSRRRLRLHVRDAWAPSAGAAHNRFFVTLAPGEVFERTQPLSPTRRGELPADLVTVRSFSALRLAGRQKSLEVPAAIQVTPPFQSRRHLPSKLHRLRELDGRTALMVRGMGTEFDSLREYVRGDDVRSIDWRATARSHKPIVKTWRPERDRRVVIVVDSSRLAARKAQDGTVYDAQVEAALLLTALAAGAGDRVDVIVADARVRLAAGPLTGTNPVGELTRRLTTIEPELIDADWTTISAAVMNIASQHSLVVFLTSLDQHTIAQDVIPSIPVLRHKHSVVFASVDDPELVPMSQAVYSPTQAYQAAAASTELMQVSSMSRALTEMGMHTVSGDPDELAPRLADLYIFLKATGKL